MRNLVVCCLLTLFSISSASADRFLCYDDSCQPMQIELSYSTGKFISIDEDYFEAGLFAPLSLSNCYTPFFDLRGYRFNDGKWAGSAGFGIRKNFTDYSALGINAYYDYRRGESKHNFHQIGLGFEWLNDCWDIRINGYLPVSQKTQTSIFCVFDKLGDGFFATQRKVEFVYSGFDAEIGMPLFSYCDFNLYGAAGPYYYLRSHQNHFWGGYSRLELDWNSILSLEIRLSYDKVYSTNVQGIFQVSFPLDFFCSGCCGETLGCHRLSDQQTRRNGIILSDHCCNWRWNWDDKN